MRKSPLPFSLPDITEAEVDAVSQVLRSGWITTGPKVAEFETAFRQETGFAHSIAVSSGTAALHLALSAIGLEEGDEVITSPYTFSSTAASVRYFGARPVFCDIEADSLNLDPSQLERHLSPKTKAIIVVHVAGNLAKTKAIAEFAARYGLVLIEDAAHLLPSQAKHSPADFVCFNFYATKALTSAEGGMICTRNPVWAAHCRQMANHGLSRDSWQRFGKEGAWYYQVMAAGYKYNLTDIAAALGVVQLERSQSMSARRQQIAQAYQHAFAEIPQLELPQATTPHSWHLYMLRLNLPQLSISRAGFVEELQAHNIGSSVHFIPLHIQPYYQDQFGYEAHDCPVAYGQYLREVSLPIYSRMSDQDVRDVVKAVRQIVREHKAPLVRAGVSREMRLVRS